MRVVRRHPEETASWSVWSTTGPPQTKALRHRMWRFERHPFGWWTARGRAATTRPDARLNYVGNDDTDLDADFADTEEGAFLAWRPRAGAPWIQYPDYDWQAGSLVNGSGVFKISKLRKGQYAFAKGDVSVALQEVSAPSKPELTLMPNPTRETLRWELPGISPSEDFVVNVFNTSGQLMHSAPHTDGHVDVSTGPRGTYEVRFGTEGGAIRASGTFVVAR